MSSQGGSFIPCLSNPQGSKPVPGKGQAQHQGSSRAEQKIGRWEAGCRAWGPECLPEGKNIVGRRKLPEMVPDS